MSRSRPATHASIDIGWCTSTCPSQRFSPPPSRPISSLGEPRLFLAKLATIAAPLRPSEASNASYTLCGSCRTVLQEFYYEDSCVAVLQCCTSTYRACRYRCCMAVLYDHFDMCRLPPQVTIAIALRRAGRSKPDQLLPKGLLEWTKGIEHEREHVILQHPKPGDLYEISIDHRRVREHA